jgi:hypothetical protein
MTYPSPYLPEVPQDCWNSPQGHSARYMYSASQTSGTRKGCGLDHQRHPSPSKPFPSLAEEMGMNFSGKERCYTLAL